MRCMPPALINSRISCAPPFAPLQNRHRHPLIAASFTTRCTRIIRTSSAQPKLGFESQLQFCLNLHRNSIPSRASHCRLLCCSWQAIYFDQIIRPRLSATLRATRLEFDLSARMSICDSRVGYFCRKRSICTTATARRRPAVTLRPKLQRRRSNALPPLFAKQNRTKFRFY
jgi:hypothetical protein